MEQLLNKQICLNCQHEEKWHNQSSADPSRLICHGWMQLTYENPNYGMICQCREFRMDNLKYLEHLDGKQKESK